MMKTQTTMMPTTATATTAGDDDVDDNGDDDMMMKMTISGLRGTDPKRSGLLSGSDLGHAPSQFRFGFGIPTGTTVLKSWEDPPRAWGRPLPHGLAPPSSDSDSESESELTWGMPQVTSAQESMVCPTFQKQSSASDLESRPGITNQGLQVWQLGKRNLFV